MPVLAIRVLLVLGRRSRDTHILFKDFIWVVHEIVGHLIQAFDLHGLKLTGTSRSRGRVVIIFTLFWGLDCRNVFSC